MSYLPEVLTHSPVNTEFKVYAQLTDLDKAWQRCERFGSHAINISQGDVAGEWVVRMTLLNDGGWYFLERVTFPVEVEGVLDHVEGLGTCANVSTMELKRIGAKFD